MSLLHDKISPLIDSQFPAFYREEGPMFVNFVKEYYQWLESSGNALYHARHLLDYGDIDTTLDEFIPHFQNKYLAGSPVVSIANQRDLIKHTRDIYQTKGTIESLRLIFQMLFGENVEVYYPGDDILRASDGDWVVPRYLELSLSPITSSYIGKDVIGNISGAMAFVERVDRRTYRGKTVDLLFITNIRANTLTGATFQYGEHITTDGVIANSPEVVGSLTRIQVTGTGAGFGEGQIVDIVSSRRGREGQARVATVGNRTGEVNYVLVNGGYGYTNVTSNVYVSANVLSIAFLNEITPETEAFPEFSTIIQPLSNVAFNTSNTTFVSGDLVYGANATTVIATGYVLTSNTTANWLLISPHSTAKITIDTIVNANTTGSFILGETVYQSNTTGNSAVGYVALANATHVIIDQRFGPFAANTLLTGTDSGCAANVATVTTYAYDSLNFSNTSITKIVRAETTQGALKTSATSLTASANVVGSNSSAIGVKSITNSFNGGASKNWVYSATTGATAEITATSSGLPGYFRIGGIDSTESIAVCNDIISTYLSVPISNGSPYGLPANTSAGYTSVIASALSRKSITIGSILSLTEKYPGFNNSAKPFVVEIEPVVAAYGKPSSINCTLSSLVGGFRSGEAVTQAIPTSKVTLTVADVANTFNYALHETIKQVRADSHVVYGELYNTNISGGAGTISVYVANTSNTFDSVSPIVGLTSTATANVSGATTGTIDLTARGIVTSASPQLVTIERTSFKDFELSRSLYGSETGSTANVVGISWPSNTAVLGNNAYVDPIAGIANGTIVSLEVVDSGVFYESGEEVILSANGNVTPGAGIAYVESTGIKSGFWRGDRGTLDSSNRIQDNEYYQEYSYEIQSGVDRTLYESAVKNITHVAGTKMYSKYIKATESQSIIGGATLTHDTTITLALPTSSSWAVISTINNGDAITQVANSVVVATGRFVEGRERPINSMVTLANTTGTFTSGGALYIGAVSIGTIQGVSREIY